MKAARYFDRGDIRIEDVAEPEVQPGTVGVDVAWCGICGTDLHEYLDGPIFVPPAGHPHPVSGESAPITLGHEMSGTIYAIGEDVTDLKVGDNVVVEPYIIDPKESTEPGSNYHLTPNMNFIGLAGRGGGLGEKIVVERRWIHPIGDIALDEAALIDAGSTRSATSPWTKQRSSNHSPWATTRSSAAAPNPVTSPSSAAPDPSVCSPQPCSKPTALPSS